MNLENTDNLLKSNPAEGATSNLFNDAYQFPRSPEATRVQEGRLEKTAMSCDPYFDMLGASDNLRRMASVVDALHRVTSGQEFTSGRPRELMQAVRGLDGAGESQLALLQNILASSLNARERGVTVSLSKDKDDHAHLRLSHKENGITYSIDVSGSGCIAIKTDEAGKQSSVSPRQAFDQILPLRAPGQRNEV